MTKELQRHYKTLNVKPTDSAEEIRRVYEYLANAWDVDRFADNPDWRKRAEAKLAEINTAYEQILSAMNNDLRDPPEDMSSDESGPPLLSSEQGKRFAFTKKFKTILIAATAAVLSGIFIWPTAYEQGSMKSGERTYSIRTHRITGETSYLEDGRWNPMPLPVVRKVPDAKAIPKKAGPAAPEKAPAAPAPPPAAAETAIPKADKTEPAGSAAPPAEKRETLPPAQAKTKGYALQITAIRDFEKAKTIVAQLKKSGFDAHMAKVTLKDQGVLYRILLDHFATRAEAFKYMTDRKIKEQYPGSFVQKTTP